MKTFSIKAAFKKGWNLWESHTKLLVLTSLVFVVLSLLMPNGGLESSSRGFHYSWLAALVLSLFQALLMIGFTKMLLKVHGHAPTEFDELFRHARLFWKVLGVSVLVFLITVFGLVLLVVPGIYFYLKYQFAVLAVIDKPSLSIREALRESARLSEGVKWKLLGFSLVWFVVVIVGAMTVVGELLTLPVATLAFIHVYRVLEGYNPVESPAPELA